MRRPSRRTFIKGIGVASAAAFVGTNAIAAEPEETGTDWPTAYGTDGRTSFTTGSGPGPYATGDDDFYGEDATRISEAPHPAVVADGMLFVAGSYDDTTAQTNGEIAAYDANTGDQIWFKNEKLGSIRGAPTVADGTLYVNTQAADNEYGDDETMEPKKGGFLAIDAKTGETKWEFEKTYRWEGSPVVHDGTIYAVSDVYQDTGGLYALNPDGTVKWRLGVDGGALARVGDSLYVGRYRGTVGPGILTKVGTDGTEIWSEKLPISADARTIAATEDMLFFSEEERGSGPTESVFGVSADDGDVVIDSEIAANFDGSRPTHLSSPAVSEDLVYVSSYDRDNEVSAIHALSAESGEEQWQSTTEAHLVGTPSVTAETVYAGGRHDTVRTKDDVAYTRPAALYALDAESGEEKWSYGFFEQRNGRLVRTAVPAHDRLYVQVSDGEEGTVAVLESSESRPDDEHRLADDSPKRAKPHAKITTTPEDANETEHESGTTVTLHGTESTSVNGEISTFEWDIDGDGEYERTGESTDITLDYCGRLTVFLRVTDEAGKTATDGVDLLVS
ncbi:PQQ-binding-like beta-propeller repeat protein [Haladaptatus sp. GCM10025707]|uniref:outer membrane protein assembly factor BamB family protein n=1 Tax=unclassified Haladaptatus TaxID=2622732 RepID=UPI0023E81B24|nr:PQQ-binding-like beta-propeller repeat protein [Haladaptatus sp. QDMS2]